MEKNKLFNKFILILLVVITPIWAFTQSPDASAEFVKIKGEITTTPEFPGFCSAEKGVTVTVNEDFESVAWYQPQDPLQINTPRPLIGKSAILKVAGEWRVVGQFTKNGVTCTVEKKFLVADLSDPNQIQKYFENAGFWAVPIYRSANLNVACRNCDCEVGLEDVSFVQQGGFYKLTTNFEDFANFRPFQGMDYNKNITNNACLCNENDNTSNTAAYEAELGSGDLSTWGHQFFENSTTTAGTLYLKASMSWQSSSPSGAHLGRMNKIRPLILAQNNGTANQARVLFTNLFMNQPIGGYELKPPACDKPEGCKAEGNYLTLSAAVIKLPENGSQFCFAQNDNNLGVIEGSLLGFNDGTHKRIPFKYLNNQFAGYYNDVTATVYSGFNGPNNVGTIEPQKIYFPITREGECKIRSKKVDLAFSGDTNYGGIGDILSNFDPDFITLSTGYLNPDAKSASFLAGTGKIIALPYADIQDISFAYNSYSDGDVRNIANGILHKFELEDSETCEDGIYTYSDNEFVYKNEDGVIYEDKFVGVDQFNYPMMCDGNFQPFVIYNSGLKKHDNIGPSYINDFDGLTSFFTPSSDILAAASTKKECTFCINDEFAKIIANKKYCEKPEHIFVEKIAQLATVYPDYFKDFNGVIEDGSGVDPACYLTFTQKTDWEVPITGPGIPVNWWSWSQYLADHPEIAATKDVTFFKTFINQMIDEIDSDNDWWNQNLNVKSVDEIICHLRGEPQSITNPVPWDKKLIVLNKLYAEIANPDAQYGVIHILAASPSNMISHVEGKTIQYYWDNFKSTGDNDNRARIVNLICSKSNGDHVDMHQYFVNPSSMPALEANIWNFSNLVPIIGSNFVTLNGPFSASTRNYDEIVPVKISSNFNIGNQTFQDGLILHVPALQAALYAVKNQSAVNERVAWAAVDLGLTFVGVGAYKYVWSSASYLRRGFIAADVVGSVLGLSAQLLDNIDDDTRTKIQLAALVSSGPEIGVSLIEAVSATRLLRNNYPTFRPAILSADEVRLALAQKDLQGFDDAWDFVRTNPRGTDAWEMLLTANTNLRKNKNALEKCAFLLNHGVSEAQLLKIGQLDDIKAIIIAENLAKRVNPSIPLNQIDLIPINAKALDNIRPNILDEISNLSGNPNLRNPDRLHSFIQDALANSNSNGWKYELDIALQKINGGASIEFSRKVSGKEIDILDYTNSQIIEVKTYISTNYISILEKFGNDVGAQIGSIDNAIKSQFTEHIGRVRIESSGNSIWFEANKQELINRLKQGRIDYPDIVSGMDNMTHLIIENSTGVHTIQKALWQ